MSTMRTAVRLSMTLLILGGGACSGDDREGNGASCPQGTSERTSISEMAGDGSETREDAIRAALQELGLEATDQAIAAGVVAAGPGGNAGTEVVEVETQDGTSATMTLTPLDPGWAVERSTWCAPDAG